MMSPFEMYCFSCWIISSTGCPALTIMMIFLGVFREFTNSSRLYVPWILLPFTSSIISSVLSLDRL